MMKDTLENKVDGVEDQAAAQAETETVTCDRPCPSEEIVDAIIRKRVYGAIGVGFIPVPLVDFLGLTALQIEMIHTLAKAHGVEFKKERVKSIISSLCGSLLTTASVPLAASLFKSIPVIGITAGAATISIMGGSTTYALGWVFDRHFRKGGCLIDFDADEAKAYFKEKVEEGKNLVGKLKKKVKKEAAESPAEDAAEAKNDAA